MVDTKSQGESDFSKNGRGGYCATCTNCKNARVRQLRRGEGGLRWARKEMPQMIEEIKYKPARKMQGRVAAVTVDWCPRDEWPRLRWFTNGQFQQMLDDGILTPGMCVTQHDKQYVVWGAKGAEQWLKPAVNKRGRTL